MNEAAAGAALAPPLAGITVIDLGQIYNGPYATFLMAMGGARVIKIEPPGGEKMRRRGSVGGAMLPFAMLNSNKTFVTLNLKHPAGCDLLREMIGRADVLVENFAPGVMDRLGVGPQPLMSLNPQLIYAAGSGYGWSGPYRDYLAMDLTVQAMSGVMASTGFPDRPPVKAGPAICDFFGGTHLYGAVMTALFDRTRTGRGRFVEVSMLESVYPALSSTLGLYYGSGGKNPPRTGNRHGGLAEAPYNVYPASDGWVAILCVTDVHFQALTDLMERRALATDPRYATFASRVENSVALDQLIAAWSAGIDKKSLFAGLTAHRIPSAPVREIDEVVHDEHMHARGSLRQVDHPELGPVVLPTGSLRYADDPERPLIPSKSLGADNDDVYGAWLGKSKQTIDDLARAGII